ncbi:GTP-binding protein, putative [Plasmodium reichenowi]|uniref:GTP-binding protein, putative n=1 Tax=Plasmodium reichenowi TaxID=5854 RepID=A0A060S469_PLARE|nr:GTP-binding protein, putative [Plasmodium reichenowi]
MISFIFFIFTIYYESIVGSVLFSRWCVGKRIMFLNSMKGTKFKRRKRENSRSTLYSMQKMIKKNEFHDRCVIKVKAGNGGDGICCFTVFSQKKNKKYASGGRGGNGGDIYVIGNKKIDNFLNVKLKSFYNAENGGKGLNNNQVGYNGKDEYIYVPINTIIYNEQKEFINFIYMNDQKVLIAKGGKGGKGNYSYRTKSLKIPFVCQYGEKTKEKKIYLKKILFTDLGIIGYPNVGKSTLLNKITKANVKIANYSYTSKFPNVGMFKRAEDDSDIRKDKEFISFDGTPYEETIPEIGYSEEDTVVGKYNKDDKLENMSNENDSLLNNNNDSNNNHNYDNNNNNNCSDIMHNNNNIDDYNLLDDHDQYNFIEDIYNDNIPNEEEEEEEEKKNPYLSHALNRQKKKDPSIEKKRTHFSVIDFPGIIKDLNKKINNISYKYLEHLKYSKILVYMFDINNDNIMEIYKNIKNVLVQYDNIFLNKKEVVVLNKIDIYDNKENIQTFINNLKEQLKIHNIYYLSALTGENVEKTINDIITLHLNNNEDLVNTFLKTLPKVLDMEHLENSDNYKPFHYKIHKYNEKVYIIKGDYLENQANIFNFTKTDSAQVFMKLLNDLNVNIKLKHMGAKEGDKIIISNYSYDFYE